MYWVPRPRGRVIVPRYSIELRGLDPENWSGRDAKLWSQISDERSARCPRRKCRTSRLRLRCATHSRGRQGEACRPLGVSKASFYRWKKVYAGVGVAEIRRLKQLEDENAKLMWLVADLTLDKTMLRDALRKEVVKLVRRREVVQHFQQAYAVSERPAVQAGSGGHHTVTG